MKKSDNNHGGKSVNNLTPYKRRSKYMSPSSFVQNILNDEFFHSFFGDAYWSGNINIDVKDQKDKYVVEAEMPGLTKDQISIDVHNGVLTISANEEYENNVESQNYVYRERKQGAIKRSIALDNIKEEEIKAKYTNGLLHIELPKDDENIITNRTIDIE